MVGGGELEVLDLQIPGAVLVVVALLDKRLCASERRELALEAAWLGSVID